MGQAVCAQQQGRPTPAIVPGVLDLSSLDGADAVEGYLDPLGDYVASHEPDSPELEVPLLDKIPDSGQPIQQESDFSAFVGMQGPGAGDLEKAEYPADVPLAAPSRPVFTPPFPIFAAAPVRRPKPKDPPHRYDYVPFDTTTSWADLQGEFENLPRCSKVLGILRKIVREWPKGFPDKVPRCRRHKNMIYRWMDDWWHLLRDPMIAAIRASLQ